MVAVTRNLYRVSAGPWLLIFIALAKVAGAPDNGW